MLIVAKMRRGPWEILGCNSNASQSKITSSLAAQMPPKRGSQLTNRGTRMGSMENLDNVELTEAQLVAAASNAQQGVRNQPPVNRRAPLAEEINLEQMTYVGTIVLPELGREAPSSISPTP
ncbi:hypothetical protein HAX54_043805 [Datura stramonium]|uniref:Uncharacterized protein n=1 Tax=Datura stramonium TaxID=4076 RepID=A0ABS8W1N1_DATST|nr:hypothetical protein [Datura stramonium]